MGKDLHQPHTEQRTDLQNIQRTQETRHQNTIHSNLTMGYRSKQRILNRRISNVQKTLKEMLNILSHHRNTNQNESEVSSYTIQNG